MACCRTAAHVCVQRHASKQLMGRKAPAHNCAPGVSVPPQIRLDQNGRKFGGKDGEYHTPQSQKLVQDKQGTVMQIDLGAAMSQMGDMEREMDGHEGCR